MKPNPTNLSSQILRTDYVQYYRCQLEFRLLWACPSKTTVFLILKALQINNVKNCLKHYNFIGLHSINLNDVKLGVVLLDLILIQDPLLMSLSIVL
jgi:hypothetical protein